jgi:hypothetical protein
MTKYLNDPIKNIVSEARSFSLHKSINLNALDPSEGGRQAIQDKRDMEQIKDNIKDVLPRYLKEQLK